MANLRYITFTGAGQKTSFSRMRRISAANPLVEWGVLYSATKAGKENRFPSLEWLEKFAQKANKSRMNISLHLCGEIVWDMLEQHHHNGALNPELLRIYELASNFGRVQLNINHCRKKKLVESPLLSSRTQQDHNDFVCFLGKLSRNENRTRVILQWNEANQDLCKSLRAQDCLEVLIDSSGGRGVAPERWPSLPMAEARRVGYAGGLGPANIAHQLQAIDAAADDRTFWVDMEAKIRTEDDFLDLNKCEEVLAVAREHVDTMRLKAGEIYGSSKAYRWVQSLSGIWLDWWVGKALGYNMVVPPERASRAVMLYRHAGAYESYQPSESGGRALDIFRDELIQLIPNKNGTWSAVALGTEGPPLSGPDLITAGLRAVVSKYYGKTVPKNPYSKVNAHRKKKKQSPTV